MAAWKALISEWLAEYTVLKDNEVRSFATEHEHNHEIFTAIDTLFSEDAVHYACTSQEPEVFEEYIELLEKVCIQLFNFYKSPEPELKRFTLQFIPTLVYLYLSSLAKGKNKTRRCIETLLIGLFNFEVVDDNGKPKVVAFRLPSLAQASIYHDPLSLAPQFLTENALRRWEECNSKLISWGPKPQVEILTAQNRLNVMASLMFIYNQSLSLLPKLSLRHLCTSISKLVTQGFAPNDTKIPRIPLSPVFLTEVIHSAYYALYNEFYTLAYQAISDIDKRATYELMPEVMLVTSAVINSVKSNGSDQLSDGPLGLGVLAMPTTSNVQISKSMITNASFRTKKLPDDIPIQAGDSQPETPEVLSAITEESEVEAVQRGGILRSSKPKLLSGLGKKLKEKEKVITVRNGVTDRKIVIKDSTKMNRNSMGGNESVDSSSPILQRRSTVEPQNSSYHEMSDSIQNSMESSDTHSQVTTESLELEGTTQRLASMQVSSV